MRVSATFIDQEGNPSLMIDGSEWKVFSDYGDADIEEPKIIILKRPQYHPRTGRCTT